MSQVNQEVKLEKFEAFYEWLKADGLAPRKSERLHKKRIFQNLLNNQSMTVDNFQDFLEELKKEEDEKFILESFKGKRIRTVQGVLIVSMVLKEDDGIKVYFTNKEFTVLPTIEAIEKIVF